MSAVTRSRVLLLAGLLAGSLAQAADEEENSECRDYFSADDPALFRFVDTRGQVDYDEFAGLKVSNIQYLVLPIFNEDDPDENNWLFRAANRLHQNTLPSTIERQMIIREEDILRPDIVRENERILRANDSYLSDAMILPRRVCGDEIELLAVVRDVWTLIPTGSASRSGGESSTSGGLTEKNLLGTGRTLSVGYFSDSDRSGRTFSYEHDQLMDSRADLDLELEDNSDGYVRHLGLVRPFYKLDSTWSAGALIDQQRRLEIIEVDEQVLNEYEHERTIGEIFYGWSAGRRNGKANRWRLGLTSSENQYHAVEGTTSPPPEDERILYPWLGWEFIEDRYWTTSNISRSHRQEDILLGAYFDLRAGHTRKAWDSTLNAHIYSFQHSYTASFGDHHLLRFSASANGQHNTDTDLPESTFYQTGLRYFQFPDRNNRWFANLTYAVGRNIEKNEQLTSGGDNLRGYPNDFQRGNRQWMFTLERRHYTNIHLFNLAYLGGAAYIDAGRTWDTEATDDINTPALANIGLGLRVSPSKFGVDQVLHLDIAAPLLERDNIRDYQVIVTGKADF